MNVYFTYQGKKVHLKLFPIIASEAVKSTEIGKQVHKIRRLRSLNSFRPQAAQAYYVRNNPNTFSSLLNFIIFAFHSQFGHFRLGDFEILTCTVVMVMSTYLKKTKHREKHHPRSRH